MWRELDPHWFLGMMVVLICLVIVAVGKGGDTVREVMMTMVGWLIGRGSAGKKH